MKLRKGLWQEMQALCIVVPLPYGGLAGGSLSDRDG